MKFSFLLVFFIAFLLIPAYGQQKNPSLIIEEIEIPYYDFNLVARDSTITKLDQLHVVSWQVTIDNDLLYANPDGNAVIRFYDVTIPEKFIEIGMGSPPDKVFWIAVQLPEMGYVVVHDKVQSGWIPEAKSILSYTDRAGLTVNNGARIVVSNLDIEGFGINAYSTHGMKGSTDPPAINSGLYSFEIISGDPAENEMALFPFFITGGIGVVIAILLITKKRSP